MTRQCSAFEELARERLLPVALETMHVGHLLDRALMPQVAIAARDVDVVDQVAIAEWMGASPVYTGRMRRLMQIEGDDVRRHHQGAPARRRLPAPVHGRRLEGHRRRGTPSSGCATAAR